MRFIKKTSITMAIMLAIVAVPRAAHAVPVGLELLLLVDVSGSVDDAEYDLQKSGYSNAFRDAGIQALIAAATGGIAVGYAEWSSGSQQSLLVDFTHLTDGASADAFADAIDGSARAFNLGTAPGSAINWGVPLFTNGFEGTRLVIDVSGDGSQNEGADTFAAATAANAAGLTINGLPILGQEGLEDWYQDNIVTPGGGFLIAASSFEDFAGAVRTKIGREIVAPEPGMIALFGLGLLAVARRGLNRRRETGAR